MNGKLNAISNRTNEVKHFVPLQKFLAAAALCAMTALTSNAQAPGGDSKGVSVSQVERKNLAPVSREILKVTLPRPVEMTLPNGLTVLILEDHRFPIVNIDFTISGSGALWEPANAPGLAGVTAQMLREGTATRSSKQIGEEIDRLGASFYASAPFGDGETSVGGSGLSDNFDKWFPVFSDLLLNANFPTDELDKLKQRMKVQLVQQRQQPGFLATEEFNRAVYGSHPAATVSVTVESIDALTSEKLAEWRKSRYTPQNTILGISGDVNPKELIARLQTWSASWPKTDFVAAAEPQTTPAKEKRVFIVDRPSSVQTTLAMGNIGINRTSSDYPTMVVLDQILGAGASSRLFLNLREAKGFTYGVYSTFKADKYAGAIRVGGDLRTEVTDGAMTEFWNEFNRIRDEKVPEAELDDARRAVVARFALSLEQPSELLNFAVERKVYGLPADYWEKYPAQISAVTADDVQRVAKKYIDISNMQVVGVGDARKIAPVLSKYGTVQVFNVEGKPEEPKLERLKPIGQ